MYTRCSAEKETFMLYTSSDLCGLVLLFTRIQFD